MNSSTKRYFYYFLYLLGFLFLFHLGNFTAGDRQAYYNIFSGQIYEREWGFKLIAYLFTNFSPSATLSLFIFAAVIFTFAYFAIIDRLTRDDQKYFAFGIIFIGALSLYSVGLIRAGLANWVGVFLYLRYLKTNKNIYLALLPLTLALHIQLIAFVGCIYAFHLLRISPKILAFIITLSISSLMLFPEFVVNTLNLPTWYILFVSDPSKKNYLFFSPSMWSYFFISIFYYLSTRTLTDKGVSLSYLGLPFAIIAFITGYDHITRFMGPFMFQAWIYFFEYSWPKLKEWFSPPILIGINSLLVIVSFLYAYLRHSI